MTAILDGKGLAKQLRDSLKSEVAKLSKKPGLAAIIVGDNPASKVYVDIKEKTCSEVGIYSERYNLPEETTQEELLKLLDKLNTSSKIHAILVQLPLPKHIDEKKILSSIKLEKDVDGFSSHNFSMLAAGQELVIPCTPKGIIKLIEHYKIPVKGKNAVVIGRSMIVGKPTAMLLLNRDATVTVCHSKTSDISKVTMEADIIVAAVGNPKLLKADMVKQGCTVIDVGINKVDGKIVGDVDFDEVKAKAAFITPVPGGVGPMTVAMLLENTLECYKKIEK